MSRKDRSNNICGKQVKLGRIAKEMHQVDLAAALSVDYGLTMNQNIISEIEIGMRSVKDYELVALSKVLEKPITWLLFGDEEPE